MAIILLKTKMTNDGTVNNNTTFTQKSVINTTPIINEGSFTLTTTAITIPEDGIYNCVLSCYYSNSTDIRTNVGVCWGINDVAQDECASDNYIRVSSGHDEATTALSVLYNLSSGDELSLYFAEHGYSSSNVTLIGNNSIVCIYKVS